MDDILSQLDEAWEKLFLEEGMCKKHGVAKCKECACDSTTNVKGNLARRSYNKAPNEKKVKMARKYVAPSKGE